MRVKQYDVGFINLYRSPHGGIMPGLMAYATELAAETARTSEHGVEWDLIARSQYTYLKTIRVEVEEGRLSPGLEPIEMPRVALP